MGLTYRGTSLSGENYCLDIVQGYWEPSAVRGQERVTPNMEGQPASLYVKDVRTILLEGFIRGVGSTVAERRESYHDTAQTILALMEYDLDPGELLATSPYLGLASGDEASINARCVNAISRLLDRQYTAATWSIKLESVDPDWVVGFASS